MLARAMQPLTASLWPGRAVPVAPGLYVITVPTSAQRDTARLQIRQALRELLAQVLVPGLGPALQSISIDNRRAQAPQIFLDGVPQAFGCSFSYTEHTALVALHLHGAVGVDIMLPTDIADWQAVARDYLGPDLTATLAATAPEQRARAFSDAWCALEANLKCHGEALGEWQAGRSSSGTSSSGTSSSRNSTALQAALSIPPGAAALPPALLARAADAPSAHLAWQVIDSAPGTG